MKPQQTLAHNILRSLIGRDQFGTPIIQEGILHSAGCFDAYKSFLLHFWNTHTGHARWPEDYPRALSAEFHTISAVLREVAYSARDFNAYEIVSGLTNLNLWLGQSYHRIAQLLRFGNAAGDIEAAISCVAVHECVEIHTALCRAAIASYILIDPEIFARESGEEYHDSL